MTNRLLKFVPPAVVRMALHVASDSRGAVTVTYAIALLTMLIALGTGMDLSNALQVKYRLDLAADAGSVACGETWQAYMEQGAGTTNTAGEYTALQNAANAAAKAQGTAAFAAQASSIGSILQSGYPQVTTTDGTTSGTAVGGASVDCTVTYQATNPNYLMQLAGFKALSVSGAASSTVVMAPYVSVYLVLDTSASMMVGSTPTDQAKVANWVAKYDSAPASGGGPYSVTNPSTCMVFHYCSNLPYTSDVYNNGAPYWGGYSGGLFAADKAPSPVHDINPCAFACHDVGTPFYVENMQQGELVAASVGATTRFDVLKQALVNDPETQDSHYCNNSGYPVAACVNTCPPQSDPGCLQYEGLLPYIRDTYTVTDARANLSTFSYNLYGFNFGIAGDEPPSDEFNQTNEIDNSQYSVTNVSSLTQVAAAVNTLTIGLVTHLNPPVNSPHIAVLPHLEQLVGTSNNDCTPIGACPNNPLKFVIIVTDGLNSDRNWNCGPYNCAFPPDPEPSSIKQVPPISSTKYCSMWDAASAANIPTADGVALWQGTGFGSDAGNIGQCYNNNYNPGFYLGATPPASTGPAASNPPTTNPYYSSSPPFSQTTKITKTTKNGITKTTATTTTNSWLYDLRGNNAVWYAGPIETNYCLAMRENGGGLSNLDKPVNGPLPAVTIAVLETPYVPLTGQDPVFYPYEGGVQSVIWPNGNPAAPGETYPNGPNGQPMSALSQALQTCATPGGNYYFQATSDSAIASGFITLFNNYVGQWVHLYK